MRGRTSNTLIAILAGAALVTGAAWMKPASATDPFIGQIQYFGFNFPPRNWAWCDGQILPINQNTALFSLLGTTFGGDGRTSFALPDMRGRTPVHVGRGPGLSNYPWGQKGGEEQVTLTAAQLPPHNNHTLWGTETVGDQSSPANGALARDGRDQTYANVAPDTDMNANSITGPSGGGGAHENRPPYLGVYCNIALVGIFPSRN